MSVEIVRAAGQASSSLPDTTRPPNYSVEDRARNWFYYTPPLPGAQREVTVASPSEVVRRVQSAINASPAGTSVREDGVLDTRTLDMASAILPSKWAASLPAGGTFSDYLAQAATSKQMNPIAYTALVLLSSPTLVSDPRADLAWIRRGGVALGSNATISQVQFPSVVESNIFDKRIPGVSSFVRKHKVPILVVGGIVAVAAAGSIIYLNSRES